MNEADGITGLSNLYKILQNLLIPLCDFNGLIDIGKVIVSCFHLFLTGTCPLNPAFVSRGKGHIMNDISFPGSPNRYKRRLQN